MSSTGPRFEVRSLIIIVPFAAAFLLGCLCICKHKMYMWTLKEDPESDAGPKVAEVKAHPAKKVGDDGDEYRVTADPETGNMRPGDESESDSVLIAESGKGGNRKSFCA